jgi:hypothetical protein
MPRCSRCKQVWTLEAVTVCPRCHVSTDEPKAGATWVWGFLAAAIVLALLGAVSGWMSHPAGSTISTQPTEPAPEPELDP